MKSLHNFLAIDDVQTLLGCHHALALQVVDSIALQGVCLHAADVVCTCGKVNQVHLDGLLVDRAHTRKGINLANLQSVCVDTKLVVNSHRIATNNELQVLVVDANEFGVVNLDVGIDIVG